VITPQLKTVITHFSTHFNALYFWRTVRAL